MYQNSHVDSHDQNEPSIEVRVRECKADLKSLIASLQPYAPLHEIDLSRLGKMMKDLADYIQLFEPAVDSREGSDDIASLEKSCKSVSLVHGSLVTAIGWLRVSFRALTVIEDDIKKSKTFNVKLQNDCYQSYEDCRKALVTAFNNILP